MVDPLFKPVMPNTSETWNQHWWKHIIQYNADKRWNWRGLSNNPNMTWEIVQQNPDKPWDWHWLSLNSFTKAREMFELRIRHQTFVQEHLWEPLVQAAMHPSRIQKLLDMGYTPEDFDKVL